MSRTKTIGTIFASLAVGAIAFFFTTPKKIQKRKEVKVADSKEEVTSNEDLFI